MQWRIHPWPPSKLAMEFGPLGGRKSNDIIVNLPKSNHFAPRIAVGYGFGPPTEKYHVKTLQKPMTKKREIDEHFVGEMLKIFRERLKNGRLKISGKICPPGSEVLDPLGHTYVRTYVSRGLHIYTHTDKQNCRHTYMHTHIQTHRWTHRIAERGEVLISNLRLSSPSDRNNTVATPRRPTDRPQGAPVLLIAVNAKLTPSGGRHDN